MVVSDAACSTGARARVDDYEAQHGYLYDETVHLNSPRLVTQASNTVERRRWDRDPSGTAVPNENPATLGALEYHLRLQDQPYDGIAGLCCHSLRDHDAPTG